jgi:hypothetical protein
VGIDDDVVAIAQRVRVRQGLGIGRVERGASDFPGVEARASS